MIWKIFGIGVFFSMAVTVGVAADCFNKIDGPCGGPSTNCNDFCRDIETGCFQPDVWQRESIREYEECVQPGVAWVNCDDRETPKLSCAVVSQCASVSNIECSTQFTYKCTNPLPPTTTVYWQTLESVYCGL
jgi:hypothetical protein